MRPHVWEPSMEFTDDTLNFLMRASAISVDDSEKEQLKEDLKKIFSYIKSLEQVPTDYVVATTHPLEWQNNVVRDDTIEPSLDRKKFFENCPSQIAGMVRVPTIIQKD